MFSVSFTLQHKVLSNGATMVSERQAHLDTLSEIRSLMEQSSKFISLSGLSGVSVGVTAIVAAAIAYWYRSTLYTTSIGEYAPSLPARQRVDAVIFFFFLALITLVVAIGLAWFFTWRKARKQNLPLWDSLAKRLLIHMLIPLVAGGLFSLALLFHGIYWMIAPAMLIFYGLALINAGKYTLHDIQWLGSIEVVLGLIATVFIDYPLLFWSMGFGVLHIVYGLFMYIKYDGRG